MRRTFEPGISLLLLGVTAGRALPQHGNALPRRWQLRCRLRPGPVVMHDQCPPLVIAGPHRCHRNLLLRANADHAFVAELLPGAPCESGAKWAYHGWSRRGGAAVAFEPTPNVAWRRNVALTPRSLVMCYKRGGRCAGHPVLSHRPGLRLNQVVAVATRPLQAVEVVALMTFPRWNTLDRHADCWKARVEGYEPSVLAGPRPCRGAPTPSLEPQPSQLRKTPEWAGSGLFLRPGSHSSSISACGRQQPMGFP